MNAVNQAYAHSELTNRILKSAYVVHAALGPGLLESSYRICLAHQLAKCGLSVRSEVWLPIVFEDLRLDSSYRADLIVEDLVLIELKAVERLLPIHQAQT